MGSNSVRAACLFAVAFASGAVADVLLPGTQPSDGSGDPSFPAFRDGPGPGTLLPPRTCRTCHAGYRQFDEPIHEPHDTWAGSMMAQSARDPLFWAALDIANQDDDDALGDVGVGDLCLRCHVPRGWLAGRSSCTTAWGEEFDGSCLERSPTGRDDDFEGIACHFCHRTYDASAPPAGDYEDPLAPHVGNAQVYLTSDPETARGPRSDARPDGHFVAAEPFHLESAFCGQCHDVTNPVRNRRDPVTGADLGYPMPIERTYSEWAASRYADRAAPEARTCQGCHMPVPDLDGDGTPDGGHACVALPGIRGAATALEGPLREHVFAGANTWMLTLLRDELGEDLGRTESFDAAIARSMDLLTRQTVEVEVAAAGPVTAGDDLRATVRVTNLAGHKFPTGYPEGRRAWVQVRAGEDADSDGRLGPGEASFVSGAHDGATGALVEDPQVRVFQVELGVWDFDGTGACDLTDGATGAKMFHFVLNDCVVSDGRIPPLGFVPADETAPVGHVFPENPALPGTLANWDDTEYAIPVPAETTGRFLVEASVLYQSTSPEYVAFLRDESRSTCDPFDPGCDPTAPDDRDNRGEKMHALWERHGRAPPVDLGGAAAAVDVVPLPTGACCEGAACTEVPGVTCGERGGAFEGEGTACTLVTCAPPPGEASRPGTAPLLVRRAGGTALSLTWSPACDAADHVAAWGPLPAVAGSAPEPAGMACGLGTSGSAEADPGPGSVYVLVVGTNGVVEGSWGRDVAGRERLEGSGLAPCDRPRVLGATCE